MRFHYSATALALITTTTFAQQCPPGYQRSKKLDWKFCGQGIADSTLECATIEVPKDWKNAATSDKLVLQLIRQPSTNPNAKSIITNPGGPGESGIEMVIDGGYGYQQTLGDFHIVSFDPRGVGLTMPYKDCALPKDDDPTKWADPYKEGDDQATENYKRAKAYSAACKAANKEWGTLIGTAYVARDIMAIVEALGEDGMIRYAGYSYGTLLGATLTAMFPDKIARVLLDGNINAEDYYRGDGTQAAADVAKGVENFFAQCADAGKDKCALADKGQTSEELLAQYKEFLKTLSGMDSSSIDRNFIVRNEFFKVLYFRKPTAFRDFAVDLKAWINDPNSVKERVKRDDFQASKWKKLEQSQAILGISCGDRLVKDGSPESYTQLQDAYRKKAPYSYDISSGGQFECTVWEQNAVERFEGSFANIDTKNPILIVNTPWDPVTPAISAEATRKAFRQSKLVISNGVGHCSGSHPNADLDKAIKKYFEEGVLPEKAEYIIEDNNVFRTIPGQAKIPADQPTVVTKREFKYPDYFNKRADIPEGCTKIPVSSSAPIPLSSSVAPSASTSASVSLTVSFSQSQELTPSASSSISASIAESAILSHSESASASILVTISVSASESHEPTASAPVTITASASASESSVRALSESASASILASASIYASQPHETTPAASVLASAFASDSIILSHYETTSTSILASASVSASKLQESTPAASASISASTFESVLLSHSESTSASVLIQLSSSVYIQASAIPDVSRSDSYAVTPTPPASAHLESVSVSVANIDSLSVQYSDTTPTPSAPASVDYSSQSSSIVVSMSASAYDLSSPSGSASAISSSAADHIFSSYATAFPSVPAFVSVDYSVSLTSMAHLLSSYSVETLTPSASATSVYKSNSGSISSSAIYSQETATITARPSYSVDSSTEQISSSGLYVSSDISVFLSKSTYPPSVSSYSVHIDASSAYSESSSRTHIFASTSQSYLVPEPSSSIISSGSSPVHLSAAVSATYPDVSIHYAAPSSTMYSDSSVYPSGSSNFKHSQSFTSSSGSYYPDSTPAYSSDSSATGSEYSKSKKPVYNYYPVSTSYTSSSSVRPYPDQPKSVESKRPLSNAVSSYPSPMPSYGKDGKYSITTPGKPSVPKITSTPCPTVAWSSQPGYAPITKTYTITTVRTITKCPDTAKGCTINSSTKMYIIETKTRTTVVATPSSRPTGNKPYPPNKESEMKSSSPTKETGKVSSLSKDSGYPSQPAKDTDKGPQSAKETKPVTPSQPAKDTGYVPQPPKETKAIQYIHSAFAPPDISSSKPSVPTSMPLYPTGPSTPSSIKVCNNMSCSYVPTPTGTKPVIGTGSSTSKDSTTLRTSKPSVSVCYGKDCKASGTPTGYKPAEFTGAASSNFVSSMVGAGALIVAFVRLL